jgi:arsenite-transporting ATPase
MKALLSSAVLCAALCLPACSRQAATPPAETPQAETQTAAQAPVRDQAALDALARMGAALYPEGEDPTRVYFRGRPHEIERDGEDYRLLLPLPSAAKGDVGLRRIGDELFVRVGPYRRTIMLPRPLVGLEPRGARLEEGVLRVSFGRANVAQPQRSSR